MYTLVYPIAMGVSIVAEKGICPNLLENISGEEPLTYSYTSGERKSGKNRGDFGKIGTITQDTSPFCCEWIVSHTDRYPFTTATSDTFDTTDTTETICSNHYP